MAALETGATSGWTGPPISSPGPASAASPPQIAVTRTDKTLAVRIAGDWERPEAAAVRSDERDLAEIQRVVVTLDASARPTLRTLARMRPLLARAQAAKAEIDLSALPDDMRRLLELALHVPSRAVRDANRQDSLLERVGSRVLDFAARQRDVLAFLGETVQGLVAFAFGRARYRRADLWTVLQDVSARSLPIVSLVAFLFGAVLAFIGSLQLRPFGAQIYVANLVSSGLALEMGGLITAVVMAGRAGAAFAAQIGTMQVNEEIDALKTTGISPTHFLVVPRVIALGLMTPLLTLYADALGMLGGIVVGVSVLDLSVAAYWTQTLQYLEAEQFVKGLSKAFTFGVLIALSGCLRGMQCGRSAQAVGEATTSAVVTSVVAIVVADAIITILIFELDL